MHNNIGEPEGPLPPAISPHGEVIPHCCVLQRSYCCLPVSDLIEILKMLQHQSKARGACEACHRHKTKCHVPQQGLICQGCQTSGRQCVFNPRNLGGRPRKRQLLSQVEAQQHSPSSVPQQIHEVSSSSFPTRTVSVHFKDQEKELEFFDWPTTPFQLPMQSARLQSERQTLQYAFGVSEAVPTSPSASFVSPLTPWGQTPPLEPDDFDFMVPATKEQQIMSPQVETKVDDALRNPLDISQRPPRPSNIFSSLLSHCSDLQGIVEGRHQNPSMPAETEDLNAMVFSMLESINSSSGSVFASTKETSKTGTLGQTNMLETMLLAMTTSLKIFHVCQKLVQCESAQFKSLEYMLLFKRLDYNIVQVRIALLQIGRSEQSLWALAQDALKRGMLVDQEIKGMVERNLMF